MVVFRNFKLSVNCFSLTTGKENTISREMRPLLGKVYVEFFSIFEQKKFFCLIIKNMLKILCEKAIQIF